VRTNASDDSRHGDRFLDEGHCLTILSSSNQGDITLNIHPSGTGNLAGCDAITIMKGKELFQTTSASSTNPLVIAIHHHPWPHTGGTTGHKTTSFDFNNAYPATPKRLQLIIVAKSGNRDIVIPTNL